ncbi:MAG: selenocysteine-specific translation elongation factor [Verrucomicrobiales bacterium]|nr:selenocysteine-specific translation elongation factor [Verrucomicrobiales bacterium]
MSQKNFILATAGHIDHGKSTLIEALSGINPDRLPEEQKRGMTIDLGFAHLNIKDTENQDEIFSLGLIDVPGHADFVKNMVAGAGSVDLAMFVVAADDGWMPQSEEHLQILSYLNVKRAVVALTKSDTIDDIDFSIEVIRDSLKGSAFENSPVVPVCALIGEGIDEIKKVIINELKELPPPANISKPRLCVDRVFSPKGVGTVITGTTHGGGFSKGQKVIIQPQGTETTIRSIQNHNSQLDDCKPGMRTALNIPDIEILKGKSKEGIRRGDTITIADLGTPSRRVHVEVHVSERATKIQTIKHAQRVRFHHFSTTISGKILFFENTNLEKGNKQIAEIRLDRPVFTFAGDRFVLRDWSKQFTIGGGIILDSSPPKRSYRTERQRNFLLMRASNPNEFTTHLNSLLTRDHFIKSDTPLSQSSFSKSVIEDAIENNDAVVSGNFIIDKNWWSEINEIAGNRIKTIHEKHPELPGIDISQLRTFMKKRVVDSKLFEFLIDQLCKSGFTKKDTILSIDSHKASLPNHLTSSGKKIRILLDENPLEPPNPKEIINSENDEAALKFLLQTNEAIQLDEKVILLSKNYKEAVDKIRSYITQNGPATAADLRKALSSTRRVIIPLLEHLDKEGITFRSGDTRVLK